MRTEQERRPRGNEGAKESMTTPYASLVLLGDPVKPCGQDYRAVDLLWRVCGRPAGHQGGHFVDPHPFDPRPVVPHDLSVVEQLLAEHGWRELIVGTWRAP